MPGQIIILNGAPRSGKSSIARAIQESFDGPWMNLGVDSYEQITPPQLRPGIGLRPGGERPDLEVFVPRLYAALYESIAAHSRLGLNVVTDVGHHDAYSKPLDCLIDGARRLAGLPVLLVGVRCPVEIIMERRAASEAGRGYVTGSSDDPCASAGASVAGGCTGRAFTIWKSTPRFSALAMRGRDPPSDCVMARSQARWIGWLKPLH